MKGSRKSHYVIAVGIMVILATFISGCVSPQTDGQAQLKTFASEEEVKTFLKNKQEAGGFYGGFGDAAVLRTSTLESQAAGPPQAAQAGEKASADDYSTTNVQVAGVDEADFVKNDGRYIYTISGEQLVIVDASPAEGAGIVSTINLTGLSPQQIYVNGNRLVVFGNVYNYYPVQYGEPIPVDIGGGIGSAEGSSGGAEAVQTEPAEAKAAIEGSTRIWPGYSEPTSYIKVYDISDRSNPVLKKDLEFNGTYTNSRMIGDYVYSIFTTYPRYIGTDVVIPLFSPDQVGFPAVHYFDVPDYSYQFTNIVSLNVNDDSTDVENKVFLTGYSSNLFVSEKNIYLVYQKSVDPKDMFYRLLDEAIIPELPSDVQVEIAQIRNSDKSENRKLGEINLVIQEHIEEIGPEEAAELYKRIQEKTQEIQARLAKEFERSVIHKISIDNGAIEYRTKGEVPGYPLNQFSMDEHNGYFRIATTTNQWTETSLNHLYVLDEGMNIVGKVEDLAKGERIFSARFIGDRAYLVTFVRIDPLFVIDLSDPANPRVLGELKIPGVSDYLHPYDENHIIGVGRATENLGNRVTFSGLKLSLFNVADVANPVEVAKYEIGDRGTNSEALYDHKAFLFDREKNLLVIPVVLVENTKPDAWWGEPTWQGAYVFSLTPQDGFTLKGRVTHADALNETEKYYYYGPYSITRALYMGDVLYTLSQKSIKASSLADLSEISTVELPGYQDPVYRIL